MTNCAICGTKLNNDLFAAVTGGPVCAICTVRFVGGLPPTKERIAAVRTAIGLVDGEFLKQDNATEARRILGRD